MTFLSPVSECEQAQISSYGKWEQAFRVFSNILTTKYLSKGPELLQYNHTMHTAASSYVWENVDSYDKEFQHHVSRHPARAWNIILQQAWTMILKDRIRTDHNQAQKGGRGKKEICKHFNKGRCSYGLACIFDHCCAVPDCGKYGHGAHNCRLRKDKADRSSNSKPTQETSKDAN